MVLNRREKFLVSGAAAAALSALILHLIVFPIHDKRNMLISRIESAEATLEEMYRLKQEYNRIERLSSKPAGAEAPEIQESLFSMVGRIAGKIGIKDEIVYMNPSTVIQKGVPYKISIVELKMEPISLGQLTRFLDLVETANPGVSTRRLSITRMLETEALLSAIIEVQALETQ